MSDIEHHIGIHDSTWYPRSSFISSEQNAQSAKRSGADFFVHMPGWGDILTNQRSYGQLSLEPKFIDDSWHIDRVVEIVTPLPNSARLIPKNIAISMAYPIYPLSEILTKASLEANPKASLIRRWPVFDSKNPVQVKRNKIIELMSPKVAGSREVLDVHSVNIGLTPEQILEWQRQSLGRRLMITAPSVDERIPKYGLTGKGQFELIEPLIPHVSVVTLKIGKLEGKDGESLMTEDQVIDAIKSGDINNPYASGLIGLRETVGSNTDVNKIDWVIKVKPGMIGGHPEKNLQTQDFLHRYIDYIREIISSN